MLAQLDKLPATSEPAKRALDYILRDGDRIGSWYGRRGLDYVYGTWSALRAAKWLVSIQNADGGHRGSILSGIVSTPYAKASNESVWVSAELTRIRAMLRRHVICAGPFNNKMCSTTVAGEEQEYETDR
jgi:squalene cyclase